IPLILADRKYAYQITFAASLISFLLVVLAIAYVYVNGYYSLASSIMYVPQLNIPFDLTLTLPTLILLAMTSIVFLASSIVGRYFIGSRERMYNIIFLIAEG